MSLLRRGTEVVTVFPEETFTNERGTPSTRPSAVGTVCRAVVQPIKADEDEQGGSFSSESRYRLRLVGWQGDLLGSQSQIEWRGKRYAVHGEPLLFTGSPQTAHVDYEIRRS